MILTETEGTHRRELALLNDERSFKTVRTTQWISLVIILAFIALCAYMVHKEAYWFALGLVGLGTAGVSVITALTNIGKGSQK